MSRPIEQIEAERDQLVKAMEQAVGSGFKISAYAKDALKSLNKSIEAHKANK